MGFYNNYGNNNTSDNKDKNDKNSISSNSANSLNLEIKKELNELYDYLISLFTYYQSKNVYLIPKWIEKIELIKDKPYNKMHDLLLNEIKSYLIENNVEFDEYLIRFKQIHFPLEIKKEVILDFKEAVNTYNSNSYRATIMLCARLLETLLFRKYYEFTGKDLLETAPGYGLGKLVAELRKLDQVDPAIMQQIHLINQIRIYSVHKKKDVFIPSRDQTKAIILYTFDLAKKLFS